MRDSTTTIILIVVIVAICIMCPFMYALSQINHLKHENAMFDIEIMKLKTDIKIRDAKIEEYRILLATKDNQITSLQKELLDIKVKVGQPIIDHVSRGGVVSRKQMRVTAYDLSVESCGKKPGDYGYGITSSGKPVKDWHTVAMGPNIPFGTKIYIPYFKDKPNKGIFVKDDTGVSDIVHDGVVDVFIRDHKAMNDFGVKYLDVYILK